MCLESSPFSFCFFWLPRFFMRTLASTGYQYHICRTQIPGQGLNIAHASGPRGCIRQGPTMPTACHCGSSELSLPIPISSTAFSKPLPLALRTVTEAQQSTSFLMGKVVSVSRWGETPFSLLFYNLLHFRILGNC